MGDNGYCGDYREEYELEPWEHSMELILPLPPSKNAMNVRTKWGIAPSNARKKWEAQAISDILAQVPSGQTLTTHHEYIIEMQVYFPDQRRRDAANLIDPLMDVLQKVFGIDDQWFLPQIWSVSRDDPSPRVEVTIREKGGRA